MKVLLINERGGHSRPIVIRGWLKGLLSLCLLGAPVALGCLGVQLAVAQDEQSYIQETPESPGKTPEGSSARAAESDAGPVPVSVANARLRLLADFLISADISDWCEHTASGPFPGQPLLTEVPQRHSPSSSTRKLYKHGRQIDPARYLSRTYS